METIAETFGFQMLTSQIDTGIEPSAIHFSHIHDIRGERIVSLPFSDYCDPLVKDHQTWNSLLEPLQSYDVPIRFRCLRNLIPQTDTRFALIKSFAWHGIDLQRSEEQLWQGLAGNARQNIRHARRSGVTVRAARTLEDVLLFHRMHAKLRKAKYRLLAQPRRFFELLHQIFLQNSPSTVLFAEIDQKPVAGIMLLHWQDVAYYKFNASFDQHCRPNDILMWHAMLLARDNGARFLDLGLSDRGQPGLVRYKGKFATEERDINTYEWRPAGYNSPDGNGCAAYLEQMTQLLTHPSVPDEITWEGGSKFYRFFA